MFFVLYFFIVECYGVVVFLLRIFYFFVVLYLGGRIVYVIYLQGNDSYQLDSGSIQECISSYMVIKYILQFYSMLYYIVNKIYYVLLYYVIYKYSFMFIKYIIQLYVYINVFLKYMII